jgi:hypothetical protein
MASAPLRGLTKVVATATVAAVAVLAVARWGEGRYARAGAVRIAGSTAAYLAVVTPPARADSGDYDLVQLLVQARALTTLPGWTSPVEIYRGTAPLMEAAAPPLPVAELPRLQHESGFDWRRGVALVPLRGPGAGRVVGAVAVHPRDRTLPGAVLFSWGFAAALVAVAAAAAVALGRQPRLTYLAATLLLALAAYADVRGAARRSTDGWLAATRLLVQEAATRLPVPRARVPLAALAPVTLGAQLVEADSATQAPRRIRVAGVSRAVVAARLGSGRWIAIRTEPAEARTGAWLAALLGLALAPFFYMVFAGHRSFSGAIGLPARSGSSDSS